LTQSQSPSGLTTPEINTIKWIDYKDLQCSGDLDPDEANWSFKSFILDDITPELLAVLMEVYAAKPSSLCGFLIEPLGGTLNAS